MSSSHHNLLIILILSSACVATGKNLDGYHVPKLSALRRTFIQDPTRAVRASVSPKDFHTFSDNCHWSIIWGNANFMVSIEVPSRDTWSFASSASILYLYDVTPRGSYYSVVAKDFLETSFSCHQAIRRSWDEIDRVTSEPHGLTKLSKTFKTCRPLQSSSELKEHLTMVYSAAAQYNDPFGRPVKVICDAIDGASPRNDVLGKIFAGLVASAGNLTCYVNPPSRLSLSDLGWYWQICSEMLVGPGDITNNTMFQPKPFDLNEFVNDCKRTFGVAPRPHWAPPYYGGHDIKLVLHRFASNIIFSNGLQDPFSSGGVLKNISATVVAVYTAKGSHCLDVLPTAKNNPIWLVKQRKMKVEIIRKWIATYYADLRAFGK